MEQKHWICPVGAIDAASGIEVVTRLVRDERLFAFPPAARSARRIMQGDRLCFHVSGVGVVAHAVVYELLPQEVVATQPLLRGFVFPIGLEQASTYTNSPIVVTRELRGTLDAFLKTTELGRERWAWFVQSAHEISPRDFARLIRHEPWG